MKVSLFYLPSVGTREEILAGTNPGRSTDAYQRMLKSVGEQARLVDELGFHSMAFSEHHFQTDGLEVDPNPLMMCLLIGLQTKNIRVGTLGNQLAGWNPIRLAEEIAMVDQILQGRLDIGIVRGQEWPREVVQVGQPYGLRPALPGSPEAKRNREVFEEHYVILKKMLNEDYLNFETANWKFPAEGSAIPDIPIADYTEGVGEPIDYGNGTGQSPYGFGMKRLLKMGMAPGTYQRPFPPFYVPFVMSPATIQWAAHERLKCVFLEGSAGRFNDLVKIYSDAATAEGREMEPGETCVALYTHIADTTEEARSSAAKGIYWYNTVYLGAVRGTQFAGEAEPGPFNWERFTSGEGSGMLIGNAEECAEKLSRFVENTGVQHIFLITSADLAPHKDVMRSHELFATKVLPQIEGIGAAR